ncbi:MAG: LemA family protein [Ruminococcus sp.]|nr:LemA family protein [Ruminococcus sp.]
MSKAKLVIIIAVVAVVVVICGIFAIQSPQNKAISLEEQIGMAQSNITVQEKRRADLIPNLVDCVKQYDKHEYETLKNVIEARGSSSDGVAKEVQTVINAVAEQYPELKSNENYKQLMTELSVTENLIAEYRSNYNYQVKGYRRYVKSFPARIFLSITGYDVVDYEYLDYDVSPDAPTNLFE